MVLGAVSPDEGSVEIEGHRLPRGRSKAMQHVGFAAGYLPLPDRLRVREALTLFAGFYGLGGAAADAAVAAGLERFRIPQLAGRMCVDLSSGQRTLVGIVKAVLHRPRLLVLDEPTASLDPDVAYRVRHGLREQCDADGTALLVTSHNMVEVERLCERVVFIQEAGSWPTARRPTSPQHFGHGDLEGVFLHLAGTFDARTVRPRTQRHELAQDPNRRAPALLRAVAQPAPLVRLDGVAAGRRHPVGRLGAFVAQENASSRAATPYLLAGIMLFHVLFQSQIAVSTGLHGGDVEPKPPQRHDDAGARDRVRRRPGAVRCGQARSSACRRSSSPRSCSSGSASPTSGWALVPIAAILMVVGWAIAQFVIGLLLRFGQGAEILAWGVQLHGHGAVGRVQPGRPRSPGPCSRSPGSCRPRTPSPPLAPCSTGSRCRGTRSSPVWSGRQPPPPSGWRSSCTCSACSAAAVTSPGSAEPKAGGEGGDGVVDRQRPCRSGDVVRDPLRERPRRHPVRTRRGVLLLQGCQPLGGDAVGHADAAPATGRGAPASPCR